MVKRISFKKWEVSLKPFRKIKLSQCSSILTPSMSKIKPERKTKPGKKCGHESVKVLEWSTSKDAKARIRQEYVFLIQNFKPSYKHIICRAK